MMPGNKHSRGAAAAPAMPLREAMLRLLLLVLLFPVLLFACAGGIDWPMGWLYVITTLAATVISRGLMARRFPDLVAERARSQSAADAKPWDKKLMPLVALWGPVATLVVAGLSRRFAWGPAIAQETQWMGLAALLLGYAFSTWALVSNRFFSGAVRIQTERGHSVVDGGPYSLVRHPGYAGAVLSTIATPLVLGSQWALVPALLTVALIVIRTALEDKTLRQELVGYSAYAKRVRYRLMPGVW